MLPRAALSIYDSGVTTARSSERDTSDGSALVTAHLDELPEPQRTTLRSLRSTLLTVLPHSEEGMKYGMPAITVKGKAVAGYEGFKTHCSYFPHSGSVAERVSGLPSFVEVAGKGTLQFPIDKPLSTAVVHKLVKARLAEISEVTNGKRHEFFADGSVKAEGSMRNGQLHGEWRWFRKDGSIMRSGRFTNGRPTGTWTTFDGDGAVVKTTEHPKR